MLYIGTSAALLWLATLAAAAASPKREFVNNGYIVEFNTQIADTNTAVHQLESHITSHIDALHSHLRSRGVQYEVRQEFKSRTFPGVSLKFTDAAARATLKDAPNVKAIYPIQVFPHPRSVKRSSEKNIRRSTLPAADLSSTITKRAASAKAAADPYFTDFTPHQMIGLDKLRAKGYLGSGIKIGIIDSGIDYTHPAFAGRCFGSGCKVAFGYDYVGDGTSAKADSDPKEGYCADSGHGTHVAGTIAANDTTVGFTGGAPGASVGMYRVFGCAGNGGADDIIIAAMLRAETDKVDILSMSLGGPGWSQSASSVAASRIAKKGNVVVVIAQGNEGEDGLYLPSSPGSGYGTIAVASIDNEEDTAFVGTTSNGVTFNYFTRYPALFGSSQSFAWIGDYCSYSKTTSLKGKVVIGTWDDESCNAAENTEVLSKAGATKLLLLNPYYNADDMSVKYTDWKDGSTIAIVYGAQAKAVQSAVSSGKAKTVSFSLKYGYDDGYVYSNYFTGGAMSSFSTYGPSPYLDFASPQIAAPGGKILSTYPIARGSYAIIDGTSMATPLLSASIAVCLSAKGNTVANKLGIAALLSSTADPKLPSDGIAGTTLDTVLHQGAGSVNISHAAAASSVITPAMLFLNDTTYFKGTQTIKLKNGGKSSVTYTLTHQGAGSALSFNSDYMTYAYPVPLAKTYASVKFSSSKVTVAAGATSSITVTFTAPTSLNAKQLPYYSGFIKVQSSAEQHAYQVPYFGVAAKWGDAPILYRGSSLVKGVTLPTLTVGGSLADGGTVVTKTRTYSLDPETQDYPTFNSWLNSATVMLRVDVISASATGFPSKRRLALEETDDFAAADIRLRDDESAGFEARGLGAVPMMGGSAGLSGSIVGRARITGLQKRQSTSLPYPTIGTAQDCTYSECQYGEFLYATRTYANGDDNVNVLSTFSWDGTYVDNESGEEVQAPNGSYKLFVYGLKQFGNYDAAKSYETWTSPIITIKA